MTRDLDILLWGIYYCDLIFTGLDELPQLGKEIYSRNFRIIPGACFTSALALSRLGIQSAWACDFGNDFFSSFVLEKAKQLELNDRLFQRHNYPIQRVTASLSTPDDRAFVSYLDEVYQTPVEPLIAAHRPKWLILPHLHFGPSYTGIFETARQNDVKIFMDCQSTSVTLETPGVIEALNEVDVFAPNLTEALQLTGANSIPTALDRLAAVTSTVVVKLGAKGAVARRDDETVEVQGLQVDVVDTTGAGDCFNIGFLYGVLKGASLSDCLRYGNICGGLSTTDTGGIATPTADQVEALFNTFPGAKR